ncbi:phytoene desaturase family protein [Chitinimonas sp. BJB300]|uniref:phytoene desaturase family protein n=1 Tax=Chitinimonas sp. BJB300 TaxID=1559339 RepID=UPI000C10D93A|nr:NAD(P)/FAD-dependent oxidoreductase [Chitinimonas sp. BJB300]PHV12433.1 FAD-dependent oxidoreductase [Chitinimonas sp. BJB300]TSJ88555.1 NAD(P)/FAD-dependent oxidoreductase [Chitinimonas sp. BJB300]
MSLRDPISLSRQPGDRPTAIVIGAGVAGMAAGSYLQMNGFDTRIFERHVLPGGSCTAWSRKGYVFDYCIDWLDGCAPDNDFNQVWRELGALDGKTIKRFNQFNRVVDEQGQALSFYTEPDRLEQHLLALSPEDAPHIKTFCNDLRRFIKLDLSSGLKPAPLMSMSEKISKVLKILPSFRLFWRTGSTGMKAFSERMQHPLLSRAMNLIFSQAVPNYPVLTYLYCMASSSKGNSAFPQGGSLGLAKSIESRFLKLGGAIQYSARITRILVENDRAVGIELKNGTRHYADYIVSAGDGRTTHYDLLEGKYLNPTLTKLYDDVLNRPDVLYPGLVSVFIGIKGDVASDEPHCTTYLLTPTEAEGLPSCGQGSLVVQLRSRYADGFAPPGCSLLYCKYFTDFDYWDELKRTDKPAYRKRKQEVAEFICNFLAQRYPGFREQIEIVEVATPITHKRYTGNFKGAILGWLSFSEAEDLANVQIKKHHMQVPGLKNLYLAGQWIGGGSLVLSAMSGRYAAQFICKAANRAFQVSESNRKEAWDSTQIGQLPQLDEELVLQGSSA